MAPFEFVHPLIAEVAFPDPSHDFLTVGILTLFKETGCQLDDPDPIIIARYEDPDSDYVHYATELDFFDGMFYGYTISASEEPEWGYFALTDIYGREANFMPAASRDLRFRPTRLSKLNLP